MFHLTQIILNIKHTFLYNSNQCILQNVNNNCVMNLINEKYSKFWIITQNFI